MAERNPYIPANVPEGSIRVSCIQHANVSTSDVKRSQEWYKKVFDAEWTEEQPRYLKLGSSEVHIAVRDDVKPHERNHNGLNRNLRRNLNRKGPRLWLCQVLRFCP